MHPPCVETHSRARTQRTPWDQEEGAGFSRKEERKGAAVGWGWMRSDCDQVPQPLLSVKSVVWEFWPGDPGEESRSLSGLQSPHPSLTPMAAVTQDPALAP